LALDSLTGAKISVGPPYFNTTFGALMAPALAAMAVAPLLSWKRADLGAAFERLGFAAAAALGVVAATWVLVERAPLPALAGLGLGAWLLAGALSEAAERLKLFRAAPAESWRRAKGRPRAAWGMTLAHAGCGVVLLGIVASSAWEVEKLQAMAPGDTVALGPFEVTFEGAGPVPGPNYAAVEGRFRVRRDGAEVALLRPQSRTYANPPMQTAEAAIRPRPAGDLYVVIGEPTAEGIWATRLYFKPLVHWIWAGALVMALGGLISLSDRRHRVGVPAGRRRRLLAQPAE
jgi:cytochrome c-type biogenesis protein CcmF